MLIINVVDVQNGCIHGFDISIELGAIFVGEFHKLLPGGVESDAVPEDVFEVFPSRREVW